MEDTGLVAKKFLKVLSRKDANLNEMIIPSEFLKNYESRLPVKIHIRVRTGYAICMDLNKNTGRLNGLSTFYRDFNLNGGEVFVFEYYGRSVFNVYILGHNCCEINYAMILRNGQSGRAVMPKIHAGGWKFVHFLNNLDEKFDEVDVPIEFSEACGGKIAKFLHFIISNGQKYDGRYSANSKKLYCLRGLCGLLGLKDLKSFHMLLFTYDGHFRFNISVFDHNLVEIVFPGKPTGEGQSSNDGSIVGRFDITVKPFHMLEYCHGVDIPASFRENWYMWAKTDYINVHFGEKSWRLKVKHRADWKRATINRGWIDFRNDLELHVGDKCIFECSNLAVKHFSLRVERKID